MQRVFVWLAALLFLLPHTACAMTISEAKGLPAMTPVIVEGVATFVEPQECYIEDPDRFAGIWVLGPTGLLHVGGRVSVHGTTDRIMGEPAITGAAILAQGTQADICPFGMPNHSLGGTCAMSPWIKDFSLKPTPTWSPARGASNVGLLVTTWGIVRDVYRSPSGLVEWLYIDDGSQLVSDFGHLGVLAYTDAEVAVGDQVTVIGVSSTEPSLEDATRLVRVIRTRDVSDVQVTKPRAEPVYPFSDEFKTTAIDQRWLLLPGDGAISKVTPDALKLSIPGAGVAPKIVQKACGDWQMDTKIAVFIPSQWWGEYGTFGASIQFSDTPVPCALINTWHTLGERGWTHEVELLGSSQRVRMLTSTFYLRIKRQSGSVYCSVSSNGFTWTGGTVGVPVIGDFLAFTFWKLLSPPKPISDANAFVIDYVRFKPLAKGGDME